MTITDAMIQQSIMKNAIGSVIAGVVFIIGGNLFGYFFDLLLAGLFFIGWLGGRWLLNSRSYVVYETTVSDKNENRDRKGTSHKFHISYDIYFEGTSTWQQF